MTLLLSVALQVHGVEIPRVDTQNLMREINDVLASVSLR
jgi:hypothetical protein